MRTLVIFIPLDADAESSGKLDSLDLDDILDILPKGILAKNKSIESQVEDR